jgi:hypothetical protein
MPCTRFQLRLTYHSETLQTQAVIRLRSMPLASTLQQIYLQMPSSAPDETLDSIPLFRGPFFPRLRRNT